ncbi:MAG: hypothetical protein A3G35_10530 [candidate division NC10 bacterium RIFCSPLOWO2_12_FULL_66_18]|nr:MAG: hypothetical protein A3H39_00145 [candidate division NC10 bacterium RIFCSPLOWO2_02_FULL_66_22]OGC00366.1 MAG: hypothetical protein A3G35_10530 [candidate division NC10 bacterium RIFCSPLOWO2_12_FULL_66_18]
MPDETKDREAPGAVSEASGKKPGSLLTGVAFTYCPGSGCTHGSLNRLLAGIIGELGIRSKVILVGPVGCAEGIVKYIDVDAVEAPHGRATAVATGIKRSLPDRVVITYQGDGDLAAIGIAEVMHAATRGERISTVFLNNTVFGMTGGQMAPTSLIGQRTTTTPFGRDAQLSGMPFHVAEILTRLPGTAYVARTAMNSTANVAVTREAILRALEAQMQDRGFSIVEVMGICPVGWKMTPRDANTHLADQIIGEYPLQLFKDCVGSCDGGTGDGQVGPWTGDGGRGPQG